MVNFMPLPEEMKLEMFKELMPCCMPIFRDRTILIFMLLLAILDQDANKSVAKIKDTLLSMLRRYLKQKSESDALSNIHNIINCVRNLPRLLRIFLGMKESWSVTEIPSKPQGWQDIPFQPFPFCYSGKYVFRFQYFYFFKDFRFYILILKKQMIGMCFCMIKFQQLFGGIALNIY